MGEGLWYVFHAISMCLYLIEIFGEGDMIYLNSFGKSIIMINSYDIAVELFEGKSLNYSDRPRSVMVMEL